MSKHIFWDGGSKLQMVEVSSFVTPLLSKCERDIFALLPFGVDIFCYKCVKCAGRVFDCIT